VTELLDTLRSALGDRYDLEKQVGEGGMATVYRARDLKIERTVAIKVLRPELSVSLGADRFLREIRVAANLQHPNILSLYDSGEAPGGLLYYVMPFIEGESLRDRLNKEQQLPIHDALQIAREAAEALQYAHERGIVHRDIKPENILLLGGHALVADFGIARAVSSAGGDKLTQTGMAVGTPHYMSPEQALGSDHVDARSDVYSLGCVLYEVLIGQPPFTGPNAMAIMARHSMEVVPSLQVVRASIPDEVEDVIMQALEKTPADRFQSMTEFAERLSDAEAEAAMARTAARRASTAARRAAASGAHQARTTGATARRRTEDVPAAAPAGGRGARFWLAVAGGVLVSAGLAFGAWRYLHREAPVAAAEGGGDLNRIAVLYFEKGAGGSDSLAYLADGLTEALIHELSGVKGLQVISSNGVRPYRNAATPPKKIAEELGVGTLVQGSVAQSGDRLRVTVSLVNPKTGLEIGNKTLERPRTEIFALQDELAQDVAVFLREGLGQEVKLSESHAGTGNTKAWELLQQAQLSTKEYDTLLAVADSDGARRQFDRADSLLTRAQALDPKWSTPIVERGWLASRKIDLSSTEDKTFAARWIQRGLEMADTALQINPQDASAIELRGTLLYWKWLLNLEPDQAKAAKLLTTAETDLRAAVAANPTAASAWSWLSYLLMGQSQSGEAKLAALRAYESDPYLSSAKQIVWRLFQASLDLEDQVEASHWCQEGQRRFPESHRFIECQMWLFSLKGQTPDIPKVWELLAKYEKLGPPNYQDWRHHYGQMIVAIDIARAGLRDSAKAVAVRARGDASLDPTHDLDQLEAIVHTILGEKDEALRLLSTYLAANPQFRESMARDQSWWFRDLRSDPRYQALAGGRSS